MSTSEIVIKLSKVKTEEVTFKEPDDSFISSFNEEYINVGMGVNFSHDIAKESFTVHLNFFYDYSEDESNALKLLDYKGFFEFKISNLQENIVINDKGFKLSDNVLATLIEISISSARGIIIAKTAGSFINQFYLPILDPKDIIEDIKRQQGD